MFVSRRDRLAEIEAEIAAVDTMNRTNLERTQRLQAEITKTEAKVEANQTLCVVNASDAVEDAVVILQWGSIREPFMKSQLVARPGSFFASSLNHDWATVKRCDEDGMLLVIELDVVNVDCSMMSHLVYYMRHGRSSSTTLALSPDKLDALHQLADYYRWPMDDLPPSGSIMRRVFHRFKSTDVKSTETFVRMQTNGWLLDKKASMSWGCPVLSHLEPIDKKRTELIGVNFRGGFPMLCQGRNSRRRYNPSNGPLMARLFQVAIQAHRGLNLEAQWSCDGSNKSEGELDVRYFSDTPYNNFAHRILAVHGEIIDLGADARVVFLCEKVDSTVVY